jgi:hypothetical protein
MYNGAKSEGLRPAAERGGSAGSASLLNVIASVVVCVDM